MTESMAFAMGLAIGMNVVSIILDSMKYFIVSSGLVFFIIIIYFSKQLIKEKKK